MNPASHSGSKTFSEMLEPVPPSIRDIALQLRMIIQSSLPNADEAVYGGAKMGMVLYCISGPNNVVCGIQPTDQMCKLFFHGWEQLTECGYRLEGSGKHARHIKIRSTQELEPEALARMISIAQGAIAAKSKDLTRR